MQISYHSTITKIQKLQNLKKKKKNSVMTGIARNWLVWLVRPVFIPVRNVDVLIPIYIPVQYIPAGTVLTTLGRIGSLMSNLLKLH